MCIFKMIGETNSRSCVHKVSILLVIGPEKKKKKKKKKNYVEIVGKVDKNNWRITPKPRAHLQTMTKNTSKVLKQRSV